MKKDITKENYASQKNDNKNRRKSQYVTADFFAFAYLWFKLQGLSFPHHQQKMALWIEKIFLRSDHRHGLLKAFRNSGKSTLIGLFCAWVLYQNSSYHILVISADSSLAEKMVRNVKHIIEKHPLTAYLKPQKAEEWAADKFTVNRLSESRDPSMLSRGIDANITGLRADLIICDDVEVPNNCDSELKRDELRQKLGELDYVISPHGMQLFIGTPHTFYSIYQVQKDEKNPERKPYLEGFSELKIPLLDEEGNSAWPERFSAEKIADIRRRSRENKFASQMLLETINVADSRLNPDDLLVYDDELQIEYANELQILKIGNKRMSGASCWWDPAFAKSEKNDGSVVACVFVDDDGRYYLNDLEYIKVSTDECEKAKGNIASLQCEKVAKFIERNFLPAIHVEVNGIGRFLSGILKQKLAEMRIKSAVLEEYSHTNKQARILEAFDVLMANKMLYVSKKIFQTGFIREMREWIPDKNCRDDALDAVAGCLLSAPLRLKRIYGNDEKMVTGPNWQGTNRQFTAFTDFKV